MIGEHGAEKNEERARERGSHEAEARRKPQRLVEAGNETRCVAKFHHFFRML